MTTEAISGQPQNVINDLIFTIDIPMAKSVPEIMVHPNQVDFGADHELTGAEFTEFINNAPVNYDYDV